jgi:hypothetical protein
MSLRQNTLLGRNPLRRPVDRWRGSIAVGLMAVFLLAGPAVDLAAASAVDHHLTTTAARQRETGYPATATIVEGASQVAGPETGWSSRAGLEARWTGPDGATHTGDVPVGRRRAGQELDAWIGPDGHVAPAPAGPARIALVSLAAGVGAMTALAAVLGSILLLARVVIDRRCARTWDEQWREVAPVWTGPG